MTTYSEKEFSCCPPFNPELWEDKICDWENKRFIKDHVRTFFYMPMNFGSVMQRLDRLVKKADATVPDWLCLSDHTSKWNMDIYLATDREVPGAENVSLTGKFYSRVYEGPFKDTGKWCKDFEAKTAEKSFAVKRWLMWYTTCPKCAKKYGKNYVAIMGQVE